jgi:ribose/xylose/arabinose/galactoside ABC-type transport system permease subunit
MGGIALEGGIGNVIGIAIGLFTLRFLVTGMAALGAPYYVQNLSVGALLILVVLVQLLATRRRRQQARAQLSVKIA